MTLLQHVAAAKGRPALVGLVTAVNNSDSDNRSCSVYADGGEFPAHRAAHTMDVQVGEAVTLIPVGSTYLVAAIHRHTVGSGGPLLGPELLPNPDFEYGTVGDGNERGRPDGWTVFWNWNTGEPNPLDLLDGGALNGTRRAVIKAAPGDWSHDASFYPSQPMPVDAGESYRASVWVKADAVVANNHRIKITAITAPTPEGAAIFTTTGSYTDMGSLTSPGGAYQLLTGTVLIPSGHNYFRFWLTNRADPGSDLQVSLDTASFRQIL